VRSSCLNKSHNISNNRLLRIVGHKNDSARNQRFNEEVSEVSSEIRE